MSNLSELTFFRLLIGGGIAIKSGFVEKDIIDHCLYALMPANRLACLVALATGLRIDDVLALRTADLALKMTIVEQKTKKKKRITLPKALFYDLSSQAGKMYVFEHRNDRERHRTRQAVYIDLKRAAKAFRLKINLSPHTLRKVYAVELMRKYGNIEKVRKALNHDNDIVTAIYAFADLYQQQNSKKKRHS